MGTSRVEIRVLVCGVVVAGLFAATLRAETMPDGSAARGRGEVYDNRHNHGHYYPPRGAIIRTLPYGYRPYFYDGRPYYFHGGVWYAPGRGGFIVVRPPVGLLVSVPPPYYTTVWIGGVPYYYADDTYYRWVPRLNTYEVVVPPVPDNRPSPPPILAAAPAPPQGFFLYPKSGQPPEQQAADRYECHAWAKQQTGFDATQSGGGVAPERHAQSLALYNRAMTACLEARNYSVK